RTARARGRARSSVAGATRHRPQWRCGSRATPPRSPRLRRRAPVAPARRPSGRRGPGTRRTPARCGRRPPRSRPARWYWNPGPALRACSDVSHPEARVRLQARRVQPSRTQEVCAMATLVRHAMTESPQTAKPAMTAGDAAALMRQLDVGVIPVAQDGKLVGLVTDRDLALRVLAERKDPNSV